jgi:hypothetical protein
MDKIENRLPLSGYLVDNHFRMGIKLGSSKEGFDPHFLVARFLQDRWFPFQRSRWYSFRLVVMGQELDYYIDEQWMLSCNELAEHPEGKILLGNRGYPVEFDNIKIYRLADLRSRTSSVKSRGLTR